MPLKELYKSWVILNLNQLMRHMSVALSTWAGIGIVDGKIQWHSLWIALVSGAFIPSAVAFFNKGIPENDIEETKVNLVIEEKKPESNNK